MSITPIKPTRSLDPLGAANLRHLVRDTIVEQMGCTVLLTTHNLQEVEELCDHVAVLHKGRLVGCGTVDELRRRNGHNTNFLTRVFEQLTANCEAA